MKGHTSAGYFPFSIFHFHLLPCCTHQDVRVVERQEVLCFLTCRIHQQDEAPGKVLLILKKGRSGNSLSPEWHYPAHAEHSSPDTLGQKKLFSGKKSFILLNIKTRGNIIKEMISSTFSHATLVG